MTKERQRAVTRADVARLAGVSTAVVSYTLNGGPKAVSPETAARVRDAVEKLGYRPNPMARSLSTGTSDVIGLIIPDVGNPFFAALAQAIERDARRRRLDVVMCNTLGDDAESAGFLQHLDGLHVRGIVMACALRGEDLPVLYRMRTRIVQMNIAQPPSGVVSVLADLRTGAELAVTHLLERGHHSVAYLGDLEETEPRRRGWLDGHRAAGRTPGALAHASFSREGGYAGMRELLALPERPTAVFASSDMIGVGALRAIHEAGLRVPEEIAVVSFDDSPEAAFATPALTTVRQPIEEMAAEALTALLDERHLDAGAHVHPVSLVVRASSG